MEEETGTSILFIRHGPLALLTIFLPWPLCSPDLYPAPTSAWSFPPTLLCSDLRYAAIALVLPRDCRLPRIPFRLQKKNCIGCASAAELHSHRRILALGLTKHSS